MKKARRIKAGVLAFTAVVSVAVTSVPVYAVEDSPVVYDLKAEQKNYPERFALCGLPVVKVAVSFDSERCTIGDWEIINA